MVSKALRIDTGRCIRCGKCVRDCSRQALRMGGSGFPEWAEQGEERCFRCQHCLAICPVGACSILGRDPARSAAAGHGAAPQELLNLIQCRRSYRSYRSENLDPERMERLKEMLSFVPTGVNDHRLSFVFIDDAAVMERYRECVNREVLRMLRENAPGSEHFARYRRPLLEGRDVIFRGAPHLVVAVTPEDAPCAAIDPVIALSYFELYAQSLGVGTVWCGLLAWCFRFVPVSLELLDLAPGTRPGYAMLFGPSGLEYQRAIQPDPVNIRSLSL